MHVFDADCLDSRFNCASYVRLSAHEKRELIWKAMVESRYPRPPRIGGALAAVVNIVRLLHPAYLRWVFSTDGDVGAARTKAVGSYGTAAKVRLVPAVVGHPFSGLLHSGSIGVLRASLTFGRFLYTPNVAVKFFIDGHRSQNLLVRGYRHQPATVSFLEHTLSNEIHKSRAPLVRMLVWYLARTTGVEVTRRRVAHLASFNCDGSKSASPPSAPDRVYLVPAASLADPSQDFRSALGSLPVGTCLYRVDAERSGERYVAGHLITESPFLSSRFGDRRLSFRHVG